MASGIWTHTTGDWSAGGAWSTGAAPTGSDIVYLNSGSQSVTTSYPGATAGVNYQGFVVQPDFAGTIATAASPLYVGSVVANMQFRSSRCPSAFIAVDTGDSSTMEVYATAHTANGLVLSGAGTWASVIVHASGLVTLGTSTYTNVHLLSPNANVLQQNGAACTNGFVVDGTLDMYDDFATQLVQTGGVVNYVATSAITQALIYVYGGVYNFHAKGGTITTLHIYGGTVNCNGGSGDPRTITTCNLYDGGTLDLRGAGGTVTVTTLNELGGRVLKD